MADTPRPPAPVTTPPMAQEPKGVIEAAPVITDAGKGGELVGNKHRKVGSATGQPLAPSPRRRPKSPNIQIYRPQLTSVLSILNRITGVVLSACAIVLVIWLVGTATGPHGYALVQRAITSWVGQIIMFAGAFAFFLHLCGGIRHLVWDTGHGFELRSIYISGWLVVIVSIALTAAAWILSFLIKG